MKRAKYSGDVTDQFHVGQIIGHLDTGGYVRCIAVEYDPDLDRTVVTGEHTTPAAPDGMRLRYHGDNDDTGVAPETRSPVHDPIEAQ